MSIQPSRQAGPSPLARVLGRLPELLEEWAPALHVPGASVAVLAAGERFECATGVVNIDTGVTATPDAVFQIGSITKIWTTTLVMQLVDEGLLDLDAAVHEVLPEFGVADPDAARAITVRHLVTHTSGIDGDFFEDTGRGDDCVERYVLACRALPQLHPPGEGFSYCNVGFTLAGRIVEKLRGMTWDRALQEFLAEPIGAASLESLPEQMAYYRTAVGHVPADGGDLRVAPLPFICRSNGPAGATPYAAARDLLQLAALHLAGGITPDGTRILSDASVQAMQQPQVTLPPGTGGSHWGLGWKLFDWGDRRVIGHDGATLGQNSFLRIIPDLGIAVAVLTNSGDGGPLAGRVFEAVLDPLAGITPPPPPEPTGSTVDPDRHTGRYERLAQRIDVEWRADRLWMTLTDRRPLLPDRPPTVEVELQPAGDGLFSYIAPDSQSADLVFFGDADERGRAGWVSVGRRLPRVAAP